MRDTVAKDGHAAPGGKRRRVIAFTQGYPPDPTTGGQHLRDIAEELARRGYDITVYAASRDYNNPAIRYVADDGDGTGVRVKRLPLSAFGKASIIRRLIAGASFTAQCALHGMVQPRLAGIIVTTAPPISPIAGWLVSVARRVSLAYWVQDLHPDQLIALGKITDNSVFARLMRLLNRLTIRRAASVVPMDEFMAARLGVYGDLRGKLEACRPWAHQRALAPVDHAENPTRRERGWTGKRVLLYSGNLGHHTPIDALLQAVRDLRPDNRFVLAIAGTGVRVAQAREFAVRHNLACIEFYPFAGFDAMRHALAAADAHVVSMGDEVSGMIHPNKLYAAMAVARPVFMLSPSPSYADPIIEPNRIGWHLRHDPDAVRTALREFIDADEAALTAMGNRARRTLVGCFDTADLVGATCDALSGPFTLPDAETHP